MNTIKYIKCHVVVLGSILLFSCSQKEEKQKPKPLSYTYETVERLHPNCKDQDTDNGCMELTYIYPSFPDDTNLPVTDTLRKAVSEYIFDSAKHSLSEASFDDLARDWFAHYDSTLSALPDYDLKWEQRIQVRLIHETPAYLSVEFFEHEFTGGTHESDIRIYRMYSLPEGERLTLSDLFKDDSINHLASVAEPVFREQKEFPDNVEYDERDYFFRDGQFSLNENFALTEKGLIFYYNPYEIAPYSKGPTKLLLPYAQIDSLLTDSFRSSSVVNNE